MKTKMTKDDFVTILREVGLSDDQMKQLHQKMEQRFPDDHERFLSLFELSDDEKKQIRNV